MVFVCGAGNGAYTHLHGWLLRWPLPPPHITTPPGSPLFRPTPARPPTTTEPPHTTRSDDTPLNKKTPTHLDDRLLRAFHVDIGVHQASQ